VRGGGKERRKASLKEKELLRTVIIIRTSMKLHSTVDGLDLKGEKYWKTAMRLEHPEEGKRRTLRPACPRRKGVTARKKGGPS